MGIKRYLLKLGLTKEKTLQEKFPQYRIGKWTYGKPVIMEWDKNATVEIGKFCSIAEGVQILLGGDHRLDWVTTYPFNSLWGKGKWNYIQGNRKPKVNVIIGNDVWLGQQAIIMSGVKIGDGAVVGARAVVTKDVPPYAIVAGNPARFIRQRFDDETIDELLVLKWWDWSDEDLDHFVPLLLSTDIRTFIEEAKKKHMARY